MALSDAKCPDFQAGYESGIGAVLAALAGINVVSGGGMLDFEMCQSLEKLLLDHDAIMMALRLVRGIEKREGDAVALIGELVTMTSFLSHPAHATQLAAGAVRSFAPGGSRHLPRLGDQGLSLGAPACC